MMMKLYQLELEPVGMNHLEFYNRTLYLFQTYALGVASAKLSFKMRDPNSDTYDKLVI